MIAAALLLAGTMAACRNNSPTTVPEHTHGTAPAHSHELQELGPYRVTGQELSTGKKQLPPTVDEDRLVRVEVSSDKTTWFSAPLLIHFSNVEREALIDYTYKDSRITVHCRFFNSIFCRPEPDFHFRVYVSGSEAPSN